MEPPRRDREEGRDPEEGDDAEKINLGSEGGARDGPQRSQTSRGKCLQRTGSRLRLQL
jgi:hypothetical protein